jgi:hypothetical protein
VTGRQAAVASLLMVRPVDEVQATGWCREIQAVLDGYGVHGGATPLRQDSGLLVRMLAKDGGDLVQAQAALAPLMRTMLHD